MIKAVIFDLDGVIVSTDDCHYEAWKKMADEEGIYFDKTINNRLRGVSRMESLEIVLERAEKEYSEEDIPPYDTEESFFERKMAMIEAHKEAILNSSIVVCQSKCPIEVTEALIDFCEKNNKLFIVKKIATAI